MPPNGGGFSFNNSCCKILYAHRPEDSSLEVFYIFWIQQKQRTIPRIAAVFVFLIAQCLNISFNSTIL